MLTIKLPMNQQISRRAKHIEIKFHFVGERNDHQQNDLLNLCRSIDNIADIFTRRGMPLIMKNYNFLIDMLLIIMPLKMSKII